MNTILVTGATGNVGRPLVTQLVNAGVGVRAVTRNPAAADFPPDVEVAASAAAALQGVSAVFLNSRTFGGDVDALTAMVNAARRAGVRRLVALAAINVDDDFSRQPSRVRGDRNRECEQLVITSGVEWVSLRPSAFATNFAGMWATQIRAGDVVSGPYADASNAPIVEADIAGVAARALLADDLVGQRIPLTGPQALTNAELVGVIGAVLGRPLRYHEIPDELVRKHFTGMGFPAAFADAYIAYLSSTTDTPALVTGEVQKLLGRPATSFAGWVAEHKALFTE